MRRNQRRNNLFSIPVMAILALCMVTLSFNPSARAQDGLQGKALEFVGRLYAAHQALLAAGQTGITASPDVAKAFFTPELSSDLSAVSGGFDPLIGAPPAGIDAFQTRMATTQPTEKGHAKVDVAIRSGEDVRIVTLTLGPGEGDGILVSDISASGWTMAELLKQHAARPSTQPEEKAETDLFGQAQSAPASPLEPTSDDSEPAGKSREELIAQDNADQQEASDEQMASNAVMNAIDDDFAGTELGEDWQVINPVPDEFVVEKSSVFTLAAGQGEGLADAKTKNIFARSAPLADGDFEMTLTGRLDAKTGYESVWFGLYENETDFVALQLAVYTRGCGPALYVILHNSRTVASEDKPVKTRFVNNLFGGDLVRSVCSGGDRGFGDAILRALAGNGFSLTLNRTGFRYQGRLDIDLPANGETPARRASIMTDHVSRTEAFGRPAFTLSQYREAKNGESLAWFDRFTLKPSIAAAK